MDPRAKKWLRALALPITGGMLAAAMIVPAGAHVTDDPGHLWTKHLKSMAKDLFYTKKQADNRFLAADANVGRTYKGITSMDATGGLAEIVTLSGIGTLSFDCANGDSEVALETVDPGWVVFDDGATVSPDFIEDGSPATHGVANTDRVTFETVNAEPISTITITNIYGIGAADNCLISWRSIKY
jgi:hypothetical protein